MNHDLDTICQWAFQWKMEFNPDPSKQATEVLSSCKKVNPSHPQLTFNGTVLDEKIFIAKKNIWIIKHLSKCLPLNILDEMYKPLVRPHLDYCDNLSHSAINQSTSSTSDL